MIHSTFSELKQGDLFFFNEVHNWGEPEILWHRVVSVEKRPRTNMCEIYTQRIGKPHMSPHTSNGEPCCGVQYEHLINHAVMSKKISEHGKRPVIIFNIKSI